MVLIIIEGNPVPWAAHQGFGRHSYNPRTKEKKQFQWIIKTAYKEKPITTPVKLHITYMLPIPASTSKIRRKQMIEGSMYHLKKPDITNLTKFTEDCLKGIVIEDDSQVVLMELKKLYSETPKTIIQIEEIKDE